MENIKPHRRKHRWLRVILWIVVIIISLPIFLVLLLQLPPVQNFAKTKVENFLRNKFHTTVLIGRLNLSWWNSLSLKKVYLGDKDNKALLYSGSLKVSFNLLSLINNKLVVKKLDWDDLLVNVYRLPGDTTYNYQFIIDAFASGKEKDTLTDTGTAMTYSIGDVALTNCRMRFMDAPAGMATNVSWKSLVIKPEDIKPENSLYTVDKLEIEGLRGVINQKYIATPLIAKEVKEEVKEADTSATPLLIKAGELALKDCRLWYDDEASGMNTNWQVNDLGITDAVFDPAKAVIQAGDVKIHQTGGAIATRQGKDTVTTVIATDSVAKTAWVFKVKNIDFDQLRFKYDKIDAPKIARPDALDMNHMDVSNIRIQAKDLGYFTDSILVDLNEFTLKDKSGFAVKTFKGDLLYSDKIIALRDLLLETNRSRLASEVVVQVPSWATISEHMDKMQVNAVLENAYVDMTEIGQLLPDLKNNPSLRPILRKIIRANGNVSGSMERLTVNELNIADNDGSKMHLTAVIQNAADPDKMIAVIQRIDVQSGSRSIRSWLPPGTIPDSISIPSWLHLQGAATYSKNDVLANLRFNSAMGDIIINGRASQYTDTRNSRYDVNIPLLRMNLGQLLQDTMLGPVNISLSAKGRGYDFNTLVANADLLIREAVYKKYRYHDINSTIALNNGGFNIFLDSRDPNILTTLQLEGSLDSLNRHVAGYVDLRKFDMYATHFSASPMAAKLNLNLDVPGFQPRHLNGSVLLTDAQFADDSTIYALDTVRLIASDTNNQQQINLSGPFGYITANGDYDYTKAFTAMAALIQQHLQSVDTSKGLALKESQVMDLNASLTWPKSLRHLMPGLDVDEPLKLSGRMNTDSSFLNLAFLLPQLGFNEFNLDTLRGSIVSNNDSLVSKIYLRSLTHPQFPLERTTIDVSAKNGLLNADLTLFDNRERRKYLLGSIVKFLPDNGMSVSLKPDLILNRQNWTVSDSNAIVMSKGALKTADLTISRSGQSLNVRTTPATAGAAPDLEVNLNEFRLSTITAILEQDSLLAEGTASGKATISNFDKSPLIKATLAIDSIKVMNTPLGTLNVDANSSPSGEYAVKANLTGNGNDIAINGTYGEALNVNVDLNTINLSTIEPLTMGAAKRMSGTTSGQLKLTGTAANPQIRGTLNFDSAAANITQVGAYLKLPDNQLVFDEEGIKMNNFVIADSLNNKAEINGQILTKDYKQYRFQLQLDAKNFMAIGPKQSPDQMIYGPAFVDADAKIRGTQDLPRVDLRLALRDSSNFTFVLPEEEPGITEREGVIVFVDKDNQLDSSLLRLKDTLNINKKKGLEGIALTARVEVTPTSTLRVIMDQQSGDHLEVKGRANLDATMDPGADLSLTGRYEIDEGRYNMSLNNLIKRSFEIEKGSSITFQGGITNALVDITARYRVEAVAGDLVEDQLTGASETRRTQFKQRVPVDVYLEIKNELLQPAISFRLDMPERERNAFNGIIYSRIKQINEIPSELNKQVMGLLVLNSFIPENPMALVNARGGNGLEGTARKSVSKLISQQLNNFAGSLIKGFDVNFDLESNTDYSTGSMQNSTNLNIGVSKTLFNDRVSVSVGSSVNVEGPQQAQQPSTLVGDVSVDYKITPDGKYRIRAYRQNETDAIVEGQIIETGASFIWVMDYNEFRELFHSKKEKKTDNSNSSSKKGK